MSRLLVDDVTKTDARALLNVNKMATISDIVAPSNEYIYASGANELTLHKPLPSAQCGLVIYIMESRLWRLSSITSLQHRP